MAGAWEADRRLWLTADRERVVEDGDPEAAFLFCTRGVQLTAAEVQRYGVGPRRELEPEPESEEKSAERPADKMQAAPANKGRPRSVGR